MTRKTSKPAPSTPAKPVTKTRPPKRTAAVAPVAPEPESNVAPARDTKLARLLTLLARPKGASLDELTSALAWQAHSVRGALSGTVAKKLGHTLTREVVEGRGRVYRLVR
jgi:hypothetical protein